MIQADAAEPRCSIEPSGPISSGLEPMVGPINHKRENSSSGGDLEWAGAQMTIIPPPKPLISSAFVNVQGVNMTAPHGFLVICTVASTNQLRLGFNNPI